MKSLTQFGTYGFLSAMLAAQMSLVASANSNGNTVKTPRSKFEPKKVSRPVEGHRKAQSATAR